MWKDPIVEELHRLRREHAKRFNYDLKAIFEDLAREQDSGGHEVVTLPPRPLLPPAKAA